MNQWISDLSKNITDYVSGQAVVGSDRENTERTVAAMIETCVAREQNKLYYFGDSGRVYESSGLMSGQTLDQVARSQIGSQQ